MSEQESYIDGRAPERTIDGGIFPFSARANAREGIFSDILSSVLEGDPDVEVDGEFKDRFLEMDIDRLRVDDGFNPETAWDIFETKYTTRTSGENLIAVPFHPAIPKAIVPENTNRWGTWYQLHLTSLDDGQLHFNDELHERFSSRLNGLEASNIFEEAVVAIAETFIDDARTEGSEELKPLRNYIEKMTTNFETDLNAWLNNDVISSSDWLHGCQDLIGIHFFMYYIQVALNLAEEWERFTDVSTDEIYQPKVISFPYGVESDSANMDRRFVRIWKGTGGVEYSIRNEIYLSWGRLAITRILNQALVDHELDKEYPLTLTEAADRLNEDSRRTAIKKMYSHLSSEEPPDKEEQEYDEELLIESAERLVEAMDNYYRYEATDAAPLSMGVRGVTRLADADRRYLMRSRGRPGYRFQMADETIALLARVFAWSETRDEGNQGFNEFIDFLDARGFELDSRSRTQARETLDSMGLLEQESDSGESVNVRAY